MNTALLTSRTEAPDTIAKLFSDDSGLTDTHFTFEVQEDKCFPEKWVSIGEIGVYPESVDTFPQDDDPTARIARAIRFGFFSWRLPSQQEVFDAFRSALPSEKKNVERKRHQLQQAIKEIPYIAIRCGLTHPIFDAATVSQMPFSRPVSIVADTSAVIQGGLDFVARHLTPQARIKVPAIVHMEILNLAERYFQQRFRGKPSPRMLLDHVRGQGAQRVLLRLEINQRIELERSRLGADPLRGVVQPDSDAEDKSLGLQVIQRSFADRLILETAIQHRDTVAPEHAVMLLTSDQGLARMALVEGIQPIFSDTNAIAEIFGTTLSGIVFEPFLRDATRLYSCSLADLLWETATSFGSVRLVGAQSRASFMVAALQSEAPWQPFHSRDDLLWTEANTTPIASEDQASSAGSSKATEKDANVATIGDSDTVSAKSTTPTATVDKSESTRRKPASVRKARTLQGTYAFSPISMLSLILKLHAKQDMPDQDAMSLVKVKSKSAYREYYNFLVAGGFATRNNSILAQTTTLDRLVSSIRNTDYNEMSELLRQVPSFRTFADKLTVGIPITAKNAGIRSDAFRTYCALSELACLGVRIYDKGMFATPNSPYTLQICRSGRKGLRHSPKGRTIRPHRYLA